MSLRQRLLKQGFSPLQLVTSGLISRRDDGSEVDRFRNRLMIPIARDTGTVIAFGGRALDKDQQPKYLNSPETPIYTKGRTLYGLNFTKGDLRKVRYALIVEGYFDFAQVYQAGGFPVVATSGTAMTPQQAQMLRRFASKAVLCYDPDRAGQAAAERSSELMVAEGFVVNVMQLEGGDDPDTFLQKRGRDAFQDQLKQSRPYLEYLLDRAAAEHDLSARRQPARLPDPHARGGGAHSGCERARSVRGSAGPQGEGHGRGGSSRNQESSRGTEDRAAGRAGADPSGPRPEGRKRADLAAGARPAERRAFARHAGT